MTDTNTEDRYAGFLQPDAILPAQFFSRCAPGADSTASAVS